jgi:hypothetical protein
VYTIVERRTINRERLQETVQLAQREFFPQLQRAPGFVGFYLVTDEERGINTAIVVWDVDFAGIGTHFTQETGPTS